MVAVIAGAGLGVVNSNLNTGAGTSGNAELGQARELVYVNAATGNLVLQNADERVSGLGPGFSLVRTYNSLANVDGDNNDQWRLGFISSVSRINSTQYQRVNADGFIQSFNFDASTGKYYSAEAGGHKDVLDIKLNGEITIQSDGQLVETYATDGRLLSKSNPNGVLTIIYSAGRPAKITQQLGDGRIDETLLDYVTSPLGQPLLQRVRTSSDNGNQSLVEYRYDNADRLQFVLIDKTPETKADNSALMSQDNSSYVIEYGYKDASSRQITSVRQYDVRASGAIDNVVDLAITYYADNDVAYKRGRVATVTQGGITTTYSYNSALRTTVTTGKEIVEYYFNADNTLKEVFYPSNNTKTLFDYYPNGLLKQITQPEGLVTFYEYDGNGNRTKLSVTGMPDIISQYDIYNNLVLERQGDNVKRNIYQIAGGKSLLRYAIDGEGGVTEYRYNHLNQLTEKLVLLKHKVDLSVVAPDAPVPAALVEQLITAAGSEIELTELRYDFRGNLKSESRYSAFNAQTKKGSGAVSVWSYLYDFRGQLLQAVKPQGTASAALNDHTITYSYDGLGRLLSKNDSEAQSVSYRFDDQERSFEVVYQNGRVERSVYDSAGLVVRRQVADGALLVAELRVIYDKAGRQIASQNEYGQWQYSFYHKVGTLAATVGATGEVVRYYYDDALRLTKRTEYSKTLSSVQNWLQNDQQTITLDALDSQLNALADADARHYHLFYNGVNKQYEVDGVRFVTEFVYDTAGLLSEKRIYKDPATSDNINKKMLGFDRSAELAAIETYGYDKAGRLKNLTDGAGYRTEFDYDGSGRKIAERAYANKAVNGEFKESDADRVQLWWYDNRGFQIAHLSADGALTHFEYNANGQQTLLKQAANRVNKWDRNNGIPPLQGGLRVTQYRYDAAGRLKSEVSPEGLATVLVYNSDGQVAEKWQGQQRQPAAVGPDDLVIIDTTYEFVLERYSYDIHGNRTAVLDARENRELGLTVTAEKVRQAMLTAPSLRHIYDLAGNLIESRDAEGGQTLYYYDANQRLSLLIDAEGLLTSYEYNGRGEVVRTIRADKPVSAQQITQLLNDRQGRGDLQGQAISTLLDSYFSLQNGSRISKNQQDILETNTYNKAGPHLTTVRDLNAPEAANSKVEQWSNALGLSSQQRIRQSYLSIQAGWAQTSSALTTNQNYDQRGLLNTVWRNNQRISETDYDAFGRLFSAKNALDVQTKTDYQLSGADRDNNKIGRVITSNIQVAGSDRTQIIRYDAFGRMLETQDALGVKNTYLYDDANRKLTLTNSQTGVSTETSRNVLGRVTDVVVRQDGALLQHSRFVYDANGNLQETYLNGVLQESRTYTKTNQLQTVKDATQSVSQTSYDKNGRIVKTVIDVNGLALTTEWDFKSGRSELKQTQGNRVSWTGFDKNGRVKYLDQLEVVDGVSYRIRTAYSYDQAGQKIAVTTGIRFTLDAEQKPLGNEDNSVAQTNKYDYDIEGRLIRQYTMLGSSKVNEVQYLYNNADQLVEKKELLTTTLIKRTFYGYNEAGELAYEAVSHKDEANKLWLSLQTFDYDNKGRRIATHQYQQLLDSGTTGNGVVKAEDLREKVRLASGLIASSYVAYDSENRVVARINPEGSRSFTRYDGLGRVIEEFVSGLSKALTPDEVNQIQAGTFGHGAGIYSGSADVRSSYVYNAQNKVAYKLSSTADGSKATVTGYQYDPEGKLTQSRQYNKQVTYLATPQMADLHTLAASQSDRVSQQFYDQADRLRYVVDASGLVTEYGYNLHGQRIAETKHNNLISSIAGLANKWQSGSLSYVELSAKYRANDAVSGSRQVQTEYDLLGRISKITYPEQDIQGRFYTEQYQYNAAGLKTHFTDRNGKVWQYQYDSAGRLEAEYTPALGAEQQLQNLKTGVSLTDAATSPYESVSGYGKKLYQYDSAGNLTSITQGLVQNIQSAAFYGQTRITKFEYDIAGRQTTVIQPTATNAPEIVYTQTSYNAQGLAVVSATYDRVDNITILRTATFKVYNAAGQLQYDIEAVDTDGYKPGNGQITEYGYNSFGQMTKLTRYAAEIELGSLNQLTAKQVKDSLDDALKRNPLKRTIDTEYDSAGRKIKVSEQSREYSFFSIHNTYIKGNRQPVTEFKYNSFGELFKTSVATGQGVETLDSYSWYDNLGRKTVTLDPSGYMSSWTYNGTGEVETYTEYARAVQGAVNADQPPAVPAPGDATTGANRSWRYRYDALGRQIAETQLFISASANNNAQAIVNQTQKTQAYDGTGHVVSTTNSDGTTAFQYDAIGNLIQQTGPVSQTSQAIEQLNPYLNLYQTSSSQQRVTRFSYDIFGNQTEQRVRAGAAQDDNSKDLVSRTVYNSRGQAIVQMDLVTGSGSKITEMFYNEQGRVTESRVVFKEPTNNARLLSGIYGTLTVVSNGKDYDRENYDLSSMLTFDFSTGRITGRLNPSSMVIDNIKVKVIDENGVEHSYDIEQNATVNGVVDSRAKNYTPPPVSTTTRTFSNQYKYDTQGRVLETYVIGATENSGVKDTKIEHTERYVYNSFGEVAFKYLINSQGTEQLAAIYVYNSSGQMIQNDEQSAPTKLEYDLAGRLVQTVSAISGTNYYRLDKSGRQQQVFLQGTENTPFVTRQVFDRWGNVVSLTDARGYEYRYQYNHQNKVTAEFKPKVTVVADDGSQDSLATQTSFVYDQQGRVLKATDANGNSKTYQYDAYGQLLVETDAMGEKTYFGYDIFGRKVAQQDALGLIQYSRYNQLGLVTETGQLYKTAGNVQFDRILEIQNQYEYNAAGQRIVSKDGAGHVFHYRYDARSNLVLSMSPSLVRKEYQFDSQGNKTSESFARNGVPGKLEAKWQFDVLGRQTQHTDLGGQAGTIQYRQYNVTDNNGNTTGTSASNQVERITDGHGKNIQYYYYNNGWLKAVVDHTNGSSSEYKYNANGQRVWELHKAKDSKDFAVVQLVETSYDEQGRVNKVQVWDGETPRNAQLLSKISYRYDAVGNRRSLRVANSFDGKVQLVEATPTPNAVVIPVKADGAFKTAEYSIDTLFVSDEKEHLNFKLDSSAPAWLQLEFNAVNNTFVLSNKPGLQSPVFNNNEIIPVKVQAVDKYTGVVIENKMIDIRLVLSTDISLTEKSYTEKKLSWFKLSSPENQMIDFASFVRDVDGDAVTYSEFPTIEVQVGNNWLDKTAEYKNYLVWDAKTGVLAFKPEWVKAASNISLILRFGFSATSLGANGSPKELKHNVLFKIEKDLPWQAPANTNIGEMLVGWDKGPKEPMSIVVATFDLDFIKTADGRIPVPQRDELLSRVELATPLPTWARLEWDSGTHTGRLIATAPVPQGDNTNFKLKVYDYLAPKGFVDAQLSINKTLPVSIAVSRDTKLVVDVNTEVSIDFRDFVLLRDKTKHSGLKYKISFSLERDGKTVFFGPAEEFEKDGLKFSKGLLTGKLNRSYPGQNFSFNLDLDYESKGETYTFLFKDAEGKEVGIPAIVDNNKRPEVNLNHAFAVDANDAGIHFNLLNKRFPIDLKGLYSDPENVALKYDLLDDEAFDFRDRVGFKDEFGVLRSLTEYLEIVNLPNGSAYLQVKGYSENADSSKVIPSFLYGTHKLKIFADDGYRGSRGENYFLFDLHINQDFPPVLVPGKTLFPINVYGPTRTIDLKEYFMDPDNPTDKQTLRFQEIFLNTPRANSLAGELIEPGGYRLSSNGILEIYAPRAKPIDLINNGNISPIIGEPEPQHGWLSSTLDLAFNVYDKPIQEGTPARFSGEIRFHPVKITPPPIIANQTFSAAENDDLSGKNLLVAAQSKNGAELLFRKKPGSVWPAWVSIDAKTGRLTGNVIPFGAHTPTGSNGAVTAYSLLVEVVEVIDGAESQPANATITFNISNTNRPVTNTQIPDQSAKQGLLFKLDLTPYFKDADILENVTKNKLSYFMSVWKDGRQYHDANEAGIVLNATTGLIEGQIKGSLPAGLYTVHLTVVDSDGSGKDTSFKLNVAAAPVPPFFEIITPLPGSISEDQVAEFNIRLAGGSVPFTKPVFLGKGSATFIATADARVWTVRWTPGKNAVTGSGNHWNLEAVAFSISATDADNRPFNINRNIPVLNVPTPWRAPALTPIQTIVGFGGSDAGNAFTYKLPADFLKAPDGNYAVSSSTSSTGRIEIADKPSWVNWDATTRTLTGKPDKGLRGDYTVNFLVYDGYHGPHAASVVIKLNPVSVTATEAVFNWQAGAVVNEVIPNRIQLQKSFPAGVTQSGYGLGLKFNTKSGAVINYDAAGLTFNTTTGALTGTLRSDVTGVNSVAFDLYYAFNNLGYGSYFDSKVLSISVAPAATPPVVRANWDSSTVIGEGQWADNFSQLSFTATDANAGTLEFAPVTALPAGLSITANGKLVGQIAAAAVAGAGDHWNENTINFKVKVTNKTTNQVTEIPVTLRVTNTPTSWVNGNKTLPKINSRQFFDMNPVSLSSFVKAPDGNSVTITNVSGLPQGVYWDPTTLSIYGMPEVYKANNLPYVYSVTIYDKWHGSKTLQGNMYVSKGTGGAPLNIPAPVAAVSDNMSSVKSKAPYTAESLVFDYGDTGEVSKKGQDDDESEPPIYGIELPPIPPESELPPAPVYAQSKSYWYSYDKNNRVLVDGGSLVNNQITISTQGSQIFYNAVGQQEYLLTSRGYEAQKFVYNAKNQLSTVMRYYGSIQDFSLQPGLLKHGETDWRNLVAYEYDGVGRVTKTKNYWQNQEFTTVTVRESGGGEQQPKGSGTSDRKINVTLDFRGALSAMQTTIYTADGEVQTVEEKSWGYSYINDTKQRLGIAAGEGNIESYYRVDKDYVKEEVLTKDVSRTINRNFNAAGLAEEFTYIRYQVKPTDIHTTNTYKRKFDKRDTLIEREVNGRGTVAGDGKIMPGSTYSLYDSNGNRVLVQEENLLDTKNITTRQMVYAADGTLLQKNDGKASSLSTMVNNKVQYASITAGGVAHHFSSSGNYLGEIAKDKNGRISSSLKDQHYTGPTQTDSSNVIQYQVQSGDSLKSLALNFYGNADYWYLIANLNGLTSSPDEALSAGLSIDIPARASSTNSANSFKPMDLQKIIGDTTPSLPYVPPAPAAGCNAVAMIVMIAITVVATIATAGALGPAAGTLMQSGIAAVTGASGLAGAAAAAVGGFVGSVAGQVAGKAMGVVDSFSLKNAFASGLTAGATAGLGNLMGVGGTAKGTFVNGATYAKDGTQIAAASLNGIGKMTMAASAAGISVGANKLAGNNKASFQWRNVVTGAATAGLMHQMGITDTESSWSKATNNLRFEVDVLNGFAGAAVGYGVSKGLYNEGSWNFRNVATDVFGNAIGNSIVSKLSQPKGYQIGDEITVDGQKGYVAGVDESGKPTSISHSADNLRVERAQNEQWRVDDIEFAMKSAQQQGLYGWSYDSGQSGLINDGLIGGIINDEMHKMRQGMFRNGQNQQGHSPGNQQKAAVESDWTQWLSDRSKEVQYLGNGLLGAKGLGLATQGYGLGLIAQAKPGGVGSVMQQLGLSQYSPLALSVDGSRLAHAANSSHLFSFGSTANMTNSFGLTDVLKTKPVVLFGDFLTIAGPLASGFQAIDYSFLQNNDAGHTWNDNFGGMASHWTKFGVDSGFAAASVWGGPVGIGAAAVYSVTDLALSVTPQYQIRYGDSKGQMVNGWEKAGSYMLDNTQDRINKAVETGVGPRGVKLRPDLHPAPVTPRGRR